MFYTFFNKKKKNSLFSISNEQEKQTKKTRFYLYAINFNKHILNNDNSRTNLFLSYAASPVSIVTVLTFTQSSSLPKCHVRKLVVTKNEFPTTFLWGWLVLSAYLLVNPIIQQHYHQTLRASYIVWWWWWLLWGFCQIIIIKR